jgi:anti-sigma factor RsiW
MPHICDDDVHAYVDGELDAGRRQAVEEAMARDPDLAGRVAGYRADKALVKQVYGPLAGNPYPAHWDRLISTDHLARRRQRYQLTGAIAAALMLAIGTLGVYLHGGAVPSGDVVEAALQVRSGAPVSPKSSVEVASLAQARAYDAQLSRAAGAEVRVPDLHLMGYRVTGLRFYNKAAEVLYQDGQNRLFTLYVRPSNGETRFDQFAHRDLRVCVWQDDRVSTVMIGPMSAAVMQRLASLTYLGLSA